MNATATKPSNGFWIWVCFAFGLLIAAYATFFVIASHHKVEEVPLLTQPKEAR